MNQEIWNRTEWFRKERFGMFIHWGLYAIPALGEWVMSEKRMTVEEYEKYFEQFDPTDYNPREWARLAKKAGMKYAVLTAKHHDGFCLFDSALTDYKATNTKAGRDLVREFLDAFRAEGLKVGLYFTLIDWHHPDYPKYNDMHHPMRGNEAYKDENINFDRYLEYMHGQVEELVTNYGKLDILWYDHTYKTSQTIIRKLVECVSKGGNFILNVGPDAKGRIPKESQEILTQVGEWMEQNGESLYECGISEYDKPEWGRYTQKGNTVYAHIYETPLGALPLYGISPQEVGTITFLSSGAQVQRGEAWNTAMYSDTPFVALGENPVFSYPLPDEIDTVLKIELKK